MPVIAKPPGGPPLFGGGTKIVFGMRKPHGALKQTQAPSNPTTNVPEKIF